MGKPGLHGRGENRRERGKPGNRDRKKKAGEERTMCRTKGIRKRRVRRGTGEEQWEEYESGSQGHGQREGKSRERRGKGQEEKGKKEKQKKPKAEHRERGGSRGGRGRTGLGRLGNAGGQKGSGATKEES